MNSVAELLLALERVDYPDTLRRLFWELLEYDPEDLPIPMSTFSQSHQNSVSEVHIFGVKPDHLLIRIRLTAGTEMRRSIITPILRRLQHQFPFSLFLICDWQRKRWTLAHIDSFGNRILTLLPLWMRQYHRVIAKLLSELTPEESLHGAVGTMKDIDSLFVSRWVADLAKRMETMLQFRPASSSLVWWCKQASRYQLLSPAEEREVFYELTLVWPRSERFVEPPAEAMRLVNRIVLANLRFAIFVSYKYYAPKSDDDRLELIQWGNIGLIEAVRRYNPERKAKFISYAVWYVKAYMTRYLNDEYQMIRVPIHRLRQKRRLDQIAQECLVTTGRHIGVQVAAKEVGVPENDIYLLRTLPLTPISLEEVLPLQPPAFTFTETLTDESDRQKTLKAAFDILDEREREVLNARYGIDADNPLKLERIGVKHGLSRERVRQLEKLALDRLRTPINRKQLQWMMGYFKDRPLYI